MGEIFRELQAEAKARDERRAFEQWMRSRGTPLVLEQTQAFDAFKGGQSHEQCAMVVRLHAAESNAEKNARMKLADADGRGAAQYRAVASHLEALAAEWFGPNATPQTAAPAAQPEPVAEIKADERGEHYLSMHEFVHAIPVGTKLYAAPPPAAQSDEARELLISCRSALRAATDIRNPATDFASLISAIDAALADKGAEHG